MDTGANFDTKTVFRVQSPDLRMLGLKPGDACHILPLSFDQLFLGDLVVAFVNGFLCIGRLQMGLKPGEVKITVPLPRETGQPQRVRVAKTDSGSVVGLLIRQSEPQLDH